MQLETGSGLPAGTTWNTQGASWLPTWDYDHDDDDDDGDHDDDHDGDDNDDEEDQDQDRHDDHANGRYQI